MANYETDIAWEPTGPSQPIHGAEWLYPEADLADVASYERAQREKGEPTDPFEMMRLTGAMALHLEAVTLQGGWRYALIKDEAGTEAYEDTQYGGLMTFSGVEAPTVTRAEALLDTHLGDGHTLSQAIAAKAGSDELYITSSDGLEVITSTEHPDHITSLVKKERVNDDGGLLTLEYTIDPHQKSFSCTLQLQTDEALQSLDYFGRERGAALSVVDYRTGDAVNVLFDPNGAIEEVALAGRYLRDTMDAEPEFLALTESEQRGIIRIKDAELDEPRARALVAETLGADALEGKTVRQVRLNGLATLEKVSSSINSGMPQKPSETLVLV
jgi:hypothetical protein